MTRPIELVCFDWGGVILRICRSLEEGCERAGLPLHDDVMRDDLRAIRRSLSERYQVGEIDCDEFFDAVAREGTEGRYHADQIRALHDAWLIEEYEGVEEVLLDLASRPDVTTGLLSNTNHRHWIRHLPEGGSHFTAVQALEHRHASHLLRLAKPDHAIYDAFATAVGLDPGAILFFDDLEENIRAARERGWQAEQIDHTGDTASQIRGHLRERRILD